MKKIYTAPTCELLGTMTTEILANSDSVTLNIDDELDNTFGGYAGEDTDGTHEADANEMVWDHFDNRWK
jgi:hypothetical protein